MRAKVFGLKWQTETKKALVLLDDLKIPYEFIDVVDTSSALMTAVRALGKSADLPQLHAEGVSYSGIESIRQYCTK